MRLVTAIALSALLAGCAARSPSPGRPIPDRDDGTVRNVDLDLGRARWERDRQRGDVLVLPVTVRNRHADRTLRVEPLALTVRDRDGQTCTVRNQRRLSVAPGDVARVQLRGRDCARRRLDEGTVRVVGDVGFTYGARDRTLTVDERVELAG